MVGATGDSKIMKTQTKTEIRNNTAKATKRTAAVVKNAGVAAALLVGIANTALAAPAVVAKPVVKKADMKAAKKAAAKTAKKAAKAVAKAKPAAKAAAKPAAKKVATKAAKDAVLQATGQSGGAGGGIFKKRLKTLIFNDYIDK